MFYVRYKEITRNFNFSKSINISNLPGYIRHYILKDEQILAAYKTSRDHGIFTDKKIVLFDSYSKFGSHKQIYTIPYKSVSTISIIFESTIAEMHLFLDCGYPVKFKFINVEPDDKVRLRILYTCINRIISNQEPDKKDIKRLITDDIHFKNSDNYQKN